MTLKTIKVTETVKQELDSIRLDKETYNLAIQRILQENKSLKVDKECLMKIAMQTEDSIAFPTINHSVVFALSHVLGDELTSDDEKLGALKIYLRPSLDKDFNAVLSIIEDFKQDNQQYSSVLDSLTAWIKQTYSN